MKKLISLITMGALIVSMSSVFADGVVEPVTTDVPVVTETPVVTTTPVVTETALESSINSDASKDANVVSSESKEDKNIVKAVDKKEYKKNYGKQVQLLKKDNLQGNKLWAQTKVKNAKVRIAWNELRKYFKTVKDKTLVNATLVELNSKLDVLRTQEKAIHSEIKVIRAEKTASLADFKVAVKAKNVEAAKAALDKAIASKEQIIAKIKLLNEIKDGKVVLIKSYIIK